MATTGEDDKPTTCKVVTIIIVGILMILLQIPVVMILVKLALNNPDPLPFLGLIIPLWHCIIVVISFACLCKETEYVMEHGFFIFTIVLFSIVQTGGVGLLIYLAISQTQLEVKEHDDIIISAVCEGAIWILFYILLIPVMTLFKKASKISQKYLPIEAIPMRLVNYP